MNRIDKLLRPLRPIFAASALVLLGASAHAETEGNLTPLLDPVTVLPPPLMQAAHGVYISNEGPHTLPCDGVHDVRCGELLDGCLPEGIPTKLLNFSFITRNDGYGSVTLGPAPSEPEVTTDPVFVWSFSHGHYHLRDFGRYLLIGRDTTGQPISRTGDKFSFGLMDTLVLPYRTGDAQPSGSYEHHNVSGEMGISAGWEDIYQLGLGCQFIRIDGLPDGTYNLVAIANAGRTVPEARVFDNATAMRLTIGGNDLTVLPPGWNDGKVIVGPGHLTEAPAVATRKVGGFDLFYVGNDGVLYTKAQDIVNDWTSSATPATAIPGSAGLVGSPAALGPKPDRLDVLARDSQGHVHAFFRTDSQPWTVGGLGGQAATSPVAIAATPDRTLAGWLASDGVFEFSNSSGGVWGQAARLDAVFPLDQNPALVASGPATIHLFLRSATGSVMHNTHLDGTGWLGWQDLGGSMIGSLSAASPYLNHVDVFARGGDSRLLHSSWSGSVFSAWTNEGGVADLAAAPTVVSTGVNSLDVFYYFWYYPFAGGLRYRHCHFDGSTWTSVDSGALLNYSTATPIVAGSWADFTLDVFTVQSNGSIRIRSMR